MNLKLSILSLILFSFSALAQKVELSESGDFLQNQFTCVQESMHKKYYAEIQNAKDSLTSCGVLSANFNKYHNEHVLLEWPVAQNTNFSEPGFYGVSNFVDHNSSYPDQIQDYNCGSMSYDLSNGYNHAGVDIFSSPFPWMKMENNQNIAVAAASGIIVYKVGDNFDKNCDFSNTEQWNAIYVAHEDGSTAWYGHLKTNSLTEKLVGETVSTGEYLGTIGSSGSSTGPHLHFELYNAAEELIDPFVGPCNPTTSTSWWREQKSYKNSRILKLMTHNSPPIPYGCYGEEKYNAEINFSEDDVILLASYLADQQIGDILYHRLKSPDGSVYNEWNKEFENNYASSYWYYTLPVSADLPKGKWTYQVVYEDQDIFSHNFYIKNDSDQAVLSTQQNIIVDNQSDYFSINLQNSGNMGLNIEMVNSSEMLEVDWEGNIAPNQSKELFVSLKNSIQDGNQFIEIFHNAENSPTIVYVTTEPISIIHSTILDYNFGEVMVEVYDTLKLPIENSGMKALQIQDVILPDNFKVDKLNFEIEPEGIDTLEVYFRPMEENVYSGTMKIISNAANSNEVEIDLMGIGIPNPLLSNDESMASNVILYPNPVVNELIVDCELIDNAICSIEIIDQSGKMFYKSSAAYEISGVKNINVAGIPSGMYFIRLVTEENKIVLKKFVKK